MKRPDPKLIAFWYYKLKEQGFNDIERGKDMNLIPGTTNPGDHVSFDTMAIGSDDEQEQDLDLECNSLVNSDRSQFFRKCSHAAHRLVPGPYKQFIIDWTGTGNLAETCRDYGYSRKEGRNILTAFLKASDLWLSRSRAGNFSEPGQEPAPVRVLSRDEIERLNYKNPKRIKDSSE